MLLSVSILLIWSISFSYCPIEQIWLHRTRKYRGVEWQLYVPLPLSYPPYFWTGPYEIRPVPGFWNVCVCVSGLVTLFKKHCYFLMLTFAYVLICMELNTNTYLWLLNTYLWLLNTYLRLLNTYLWLLNIYLQLLNTYLHLLYTYLHYNVDDYVGYYVG